jgi:hypothetical protein
MLFEVHGFAGLGLSVSSILIAIRTVVTASVLKKCYIGMVSGFIVFL